MATIKKKSPTKRPPLTNRKSPTKKQDNEVSSGKMFYIPPHMIKVEDGFNKRLDYGSEKFENLKNSIQKQGVKEAIRVIVDPNNKSQYLVREGHRRFRAVELLLKSGCQIKKIPAFITKESKEESLVRMLSSNDGKAFTSIEKGYVCKQLIDYSWTVNQIAEETGFTVNQVYTFLKLVELPKKYHMMIAKKEISDVMIVALFRKYKDDPSKAEAEIDLAIKNGNKTKDKLFQKIEKESKKTGVKAPKKSEVKIKVSNKHLSPKSGLNSFSKKLEEVIILAEKKPSSYDMKFIEKLNVLYQCGISGGDVAEMLDVVKK